MLQLKNERSAELFVTINAKNMRKLISTFGKTHLMLSSAMSFCGVPSTYLLCLVVNQGLHTTH